MPDRTDTTPPAPLSLEGIVSPTKRVPSVLNSIVSLSTCAISVRENTSHPLAPPNNSSPIRPHKLAVYLREYTPSLASYLVDGFLQGFRIQCVFPPRPSVPSNHPSALQNSAIVDNKIAKELLAGRIAGPFVYPPLDNLICSPLGLVPKKAPNEFRLIHNLSFPQGDSVNDGIPSEFSRVTYEDLDHCISIIQSIGRNTLISKAGLEVHFAFFLFIRTINTSWVSHGVGYST
jgi:hypothetical protein